jgi:hypothetical protein
VERLFAEAASSGTPRVEQHSLSRAELVDILSDGHAVAIVLVDRRRLYDEGGPAARASRLVESSWWIASSSTDAASTTSESSSRARLGRLLSRTVGLIFPSVLRPLVDEPAGPPEPEPGSGMERARAEAHVLGGGGFTGHYVCVVGLSHGADAYVVHDPGRDRGLLRFSLDELDRARLSFGTDDDVIVIRDERLPRHYGQALAAHGRQ